MKIQDSKLKINNIKLLNLNDVPDVINLKFPDKKTVYFTYFSDKDINKEITINLNSEKCKAYLKGAVYLFGQAGCNLKVNINHIKGKNHARVHIKTVLEDASKFNFEGMIKIGEKSHRSDSYLKQENLVVSDNAICNTSPQLEIKADDVKASHGATVGGFNEEQLFYLKSRGLPEDSAKLILEEAFLISVFKGKVKSLPFKIF